MAITTLSLGSVGKKVGYTLYFISLIIIDGLVHLEEAFNGNSMISPFNFEVNVCIFYAFHRL